jgi:phosphatidylglycerol:prolipoprotein diacylglycerol transferase
VIPYLSPPTLSLFGSEHPVFGLLLFASVLATYVAIAVRGRARALAEPRAVDRFAQVLLLGAMAGAHTGGILTDHGTSALSRPALFLSSSASFSSGAGVAAAALVGACYLGFARRDPRPWADAVAWAFPFGLLIARAGCALTHDHPGRLSSSWLAVQFPAGPRLDCGLLEWLAAPFLVALALVLGRRRDPPGRLAAVIGGVYALLRFSLDFLRATDLPGSDTRLLGLTFAQWVCLPLLGGCAYLAATSRAPARSGGEA